MDRRSFLTALGGATAGLAMAGLPAAACSPVTGRASQPIGLQLYTVRSAMAQDVAGTLERVAAAGYHEVEFAGYFDQPLDALREVLDRTGLRAPSAHVSLDALEDPAWPETLHAARALGHRYLVVPWIAPDQRRSIHDYHQVAERLERAGARAAAAGLRLAYHNHEYEFEPMAGEVPYDVLAGTDPELVSLQLDLYWIRKAGADASEYFRRHPGRFPSVHVKDMDEAGRMVDVGAGVIDWPTLLDEARAAGVRHLFVEHDQPEDPFRTIRNSFDYLSSLEA